ncbi:ladderlectin-like [Salarias fasciatus]|uniref:ladderlectin-like n=1 Tax=Salarias fasciatus TaxID=181472 RepID=UPI001176E483|nr:ladderlectin-like [Salarias fasciatus]
MAGASREQECVVIKVCSPRAPAEQPAALEEAVKEAQEELAAAPEAELLVKSEDESLAPEDLVPASRNARSNSCPYGWSSYNSRCFKFIHSAMSWYNAESYCYNLGGHLASVSNPREYSFLQRLTQGAGQSVAWLGGFYLQNRWIWIDGTGLYYTNWYAPSTASSYPCMVLRNLYGWGNTNCGTAYRFICSINPSNC